MDFSHYGGPSEEWLAVEKTLPALTFDLSQDPLSLQAAINTEREKLKEVEIEPYVSKISITTHVIPTRDGSSIGARSYRPVSKPKDEKLPVYMYFHGGGFIFGSLDTEDAACARNADRTGVLVFHVNYRHTPTHTFPTAWHDTQDALAWLHANAADLNIDPHKIVVGGISAGGTLAASLALEKHLGKIDVLKGLPDLAGQVLIIPCMNTIEGHYQGAGKRLKNPDISSIKENENAPILPRRTMEKFYELLKLPSVELADTRVNMGNASPEEVKGLPPTVFGIAGLDPLRDDALLYAEMLAGAGVPTNISLFKGVPHGFRRFGGLLSACEHYDACISDGILWALEKPKATGKFEVKLPVP